MQTLRTAIAVAWAVFWLYWLISAGFAKTSVRRGWRLRLPSLMIVAVIVALRRVGGGGLVVHSLAVGVVGAAVLAVGLGVAVWARVHLGRNWGMPMTERAEPELITSGPYRYVRHPIYTGLLLGLLGTVIASNLLGLIIVAVATVYFVRAATVEEGNLTRVFPDAYPAYRERTKMLIPFVL